MVRTFIKQKTEVDMDGDFPMEGPEPPDYGDQPADADQPDQSTKETQEWFMADYDEVELNLRESLKKKVFNQLTRLPLLLSQTQFPSRMLRKIG